MTRLTPYLLGLLAVAACAAVVGCAPSRAASVSVSERALAPPTLDAAAVSRARDRVRRGDPALVPAARQLAAEAGAMVGRRFATVVDKDQLPPSGDRHDYYSLAPYWWPDPDTPSGLPYIRRDGEVNPEARELDDRPLSDALDGIRTLSWAWYFSGDARYADKAAQIVRQWWVDPATRMNPNLDYAQGVKGISDGRMFGIIETSSMPEVLDALAALKTSPALSDAGWTAVDSWLSEFLIWLRTSEFGRGESDWINNHATAYDAQVAALALYLGQPDVAREVLAAFPARRIDTQIEPDGRQPEELARTKSLGYSAYNIHHALNAAALAPQVGVDLLGYVSADGRSLRGAIDFLAPYAGDLAAWPYPQIDRERGVGAERLALVLRQATILYREPAFEAARQRLDPGSTARYVLLLPLE